MIKRQLLPCEIDFDDLLKSNLFTSLYRSIVCTFDHLDDQRLDDLQQWIKEGGIYYVYMFICKNSYTSKEERKMIKKFSISPFDFRFIKQYGVSTEEIVSIFEKNALY